ncbi:hypothetical protein F5B22DRAFT_651065 [Xylaria bambusicola]|uniref:uncharacterized protein n=1 Tax=Xylaria bambusicola TaxID=326684 RepID=UPI0020088D1B|nr:uncharacterized protein F5B22DRAFT_651065 [Xylaria bambusicola]KAI0506131.1 hypothetical protein F5B22DRAFT_651065 [Xylaria bambusicola]
MAFLSNPRTRADSLSRYCRCSEGKQPALGHTPGDVSGPFTRSLRDFLRLRVGLGPERSQVDSIAAKAHDASIFSRASYHCRLIATIPIYLFCTSRSLGQLDGCFTEGNGPHFESQAALSRFSDESKVSSTNADLFGNRTTALPGHVRVYQFSLLSTEFKDTGWTSDGSDKYLLRVSWRVFVGSTLRGIIRRGNVLDLFGANAILKIMWFLSNTDYLPNSDVIIYDIS